MENLDCQTGGTSALGLVAPEYSEDQFIELLDYRDPIAKASIWLHKHLAKIVHVIKDDKAWYSGKDSTPPKRLLSEMFEPTQNTLCDRFRYYGEQLVLYKPGQVPRDIIDVDYKCARILVARLYWCCHDDSLIASLARTLKEFWNLLTNPDYFDDVDYQNKLQGQISKIVDGFGSVSNHFVVIEKRKLHPERYANENDIRETLKEVRDNTSATLTISTETRDVVTRLDARDRRARKNARLRFTIEVQEQVYGIWETGRRNPAVKQGSKNHAKASYEDVFTYYQRDLRALNITSVEAFKACLGARIDRISRQQQGKKS